MGNIACFPVFKRHCVERKKVLEIVPLIHVIDDECEEDEDDDVQRLMNVAIG